MDLKRFRPHYFPQKFAEVGSFLHGLVPLSIALRGNLFMAKLGLGHNKGAARGVRTMKPHESGRKPYNIHQIFCL